MPFWNHNWGELNYMPPPIFSRYFTIFYDYMIAGVLGAPKRPNSSAHVSQQRHQLSQPQVHQRPYSADHVSQQRHQLTQPQVTNDPIQQTMSLNNVNNSLNPRYTNDPIPQLMSLNNVTNSLNPRYTNNPIQIFLVEAKPFLFLKGLLN